LFGKQERCQQIIVSKDFRHFYPFFSEKKALGISFSKMIDLIHLLEHKI
jgi:hypothetical protein